MKKLRDQQKKKKESTDILIEVNDRILRLAEGLARSYPAASQGAPNFHLPARMRGAHNARARGSSTRTTPASASQLAALQAGRDKLRQKNKDKAKQEKLKLATKVKQ